MGWLTTCVSKAVLELPSSDTYQGLVVFFYYLAALESDAALCEGLPAGETKVTALVV